MASESMLHNMLKCHLGTLHPQFFNKSRDIFARKLNNLNRQELTISKFTQRSSKTLLAFYQEAHRIAKCKKPHTIAEELRLPAAVDLARTIIG